jgi:hypothetical protein
MKASNNVFKDRVIVPKFSGSGIEKKVVKRAQANVM